MNFNQLNCDFYDAFAEEFSRSRKAINPGITRVLKSLDLSAVLDVGCGDGRVSRALPEGCRYVGLDFSAKLIGRACRGDPRGRPRGQAGQGQALPLQQRHFVLADVSVSLPLASGSFPTVVCFATLHHLPERLPLVRELARVTQPGGRIAISVWQITHNERMRKKIVEDLGSGDYVLDWKSGGRGLRFVHEVTEDELRMLAREAGLTVMATYRSDGRSGDLGLYAILAR